MKALKVLLVFGLFLQVLILGLSCEKESEVRENHNDWIIMGEEEGMYVQAFNPSLELHPESGRLAILPDPDLADSLYFYRRSSGPTGCRNYVVELMLASSSSIRFLFQEEEHLAYYHESWTEEHYPAYPPYHGYEVARILEKTTDFVEGDFLVGSMSEEVIKAFGSSEEAFKSDYFREGGSFKYHYDSRLAYSLGPEPGNACRWTADSSFVSGDTTFLYFTDQGSRYSYNEALYDEDGVYVCFSLEDGERQRLGWLYLITNGISVSVSECAIQY